MGLDSILFLFDSIWVSVSVFFSPNRKENHVVGGGSTVDHKYFLGFLGFWCHLLDVSWFVSSSETQFDPDKRESGGPTDSILCSDSIAGVQSKNRRRVRIMFLHLRS